jgi:hypothetical protein
MVMNVLPCVSRLLATGLLLSWGVVAPQAVAAPIGRLIETTNESCLDLHLAYLDGGGHWVDIPWGQSRNFNVSNGALTWKCGGSRERTGCPGETRTVSVTRSQGGAFTVQCFEAARSDGAKELEWTSEACSQDALTIVGTRGGVIIHFARSGTVDVASGDVTWYCQGARERTGCPHGTNAVEIVRSPGPPFTVTCLRK